MAIADLVPFDQQHLDLLSSSFIVAPINAAVVVFNYFHDIELTL